MREGDKMRGATLQCVKKLGGKWIFPTTLLLVEVNSAQAIFTVILFYIFTLYTVYIWVSLISKCWNTQRLISGKGVHMYDDIFIRCLTVGAIRLFWL